MFDSLTMLLTHHPQVCRLAEPSHQEGTPMTSYTYSRVNDHILALAEIGENPSQCGCDTCYSLISRTASQPSKVALRGKPLASRPPAKKINKSRRRSGSFRKRAARVRALDEHCRYCITGPAETVDHVIPKSRGGSNGLLNLVGCCDGCNQKKGDSTPKEAGLVLHLPLRFFNYTN